jgi:hypothetical protein
VVLDPAAILAAVAAPVASLISSDIAAAAGLVSQAGLPAGVLGDTSAAGLAAAQTQIATGISSTGGALSGNALALNTAPDSATGIAALQAASANAAKLAGLTGLSCYVVRAAVNQANELS